MLASGASKVHIKGIDLRFGLHFVALLRPDLLPVYAEG